MKQLKYFLCFSVLAAMTGNISHASSVGVTTSSVGRSPASLWDDLKGLFKQVGQINPAPSPVPSAPSSAPVVSHAVIQNKANVAPAPIAPVSKVAQAAPIAPVQKSSVAAPASNANACSPIGPQRIAVILASYPGAPSDSAVPDANYIQSLFTGTDVGFSIADFYKTISGGKTWFSSVKIVGPYQSTPFISKNDSLGDYYGSLEQWESHLLDLAAPDLDLMNIDRIVFITPEALDSVTGTPVGYFAGLSAQGICDLKYSGAQGSRGFAHSYIMALPSYHGIDLNRMFGPGVLDAYPAEEQKKMIQEQTSKQMAIDMSTIVHELGHTFGLGHADAVQRPTQGLPTVSSDDEVLPAASSNMHVEQYGDPFDVMANSNFRWLNVPQLDQLGWIDHDTQLQKVTSNGSFRIYPLDLSNSDPSKLRGIKIPRAIQSPSENTDSFLWVEYRSGSFPYDLDSTGLNRNTDGALVHYTDPEQLHYEPGNPYYTPNESILLNFAPTGMPISQFQKDYTLKGIWKDPHSMVRLQVIQVTPEFMDIQVSFEQ